MFGWFLIENLTHTLPYSLAWRIHTRLGKNRHVFHIGVSIYSNHIFQRCFCFQFGTSSYQSNSCRIPSSPLALEFYLWASKQLRWSRSLCLHLLVHLEFFHMLYWRFLFNVILIQLNQDFSSLIVTQCIFVQASCCVSDRSVYETYRDGLCYSVFKMETLLYPIIALDFRLFVPNRTFSHIF